MKVKTETENLVKVTVDLKINPAKCTPLLQF